MDPISIQIIDVEHTGEDEAADQALLEVGWVTLLVNDVGLTMRDAEPFAGSVLINPGRPIPPESMGIHHITDEDVAGAPAWRDVADQVFSVKPTHYAAFAGDEAATFGQWTCGKPWIDVRKVALRIWGDAPRHNLQTLRYWRKPEGMVRGRARPAHRAYPDAYVTGHLLKALFEDGATIEDMLAWSAEPALEVKCWIGSGRGMLWKDVDSGLMHWILDKDFRDDIKFTCRYWLAKREAEWAAQRAEQAPAPSAPPDDNPPAPFDDDAPF